MIYWFCGVICGSGATLLLYSILVGKRIQEEQDKACKCIYKYEEYRRKIRTLEYQKHELEKKLESSNYTDDYTGDYLGFEETK
ncbi:hypothetical protein [Holdemanella porci]|uniref:hypothetical protein n=1 Tax=Holdemanella porci TaxID=2652276 RepID=UPI0022E2954E|nr:hypothetical protein [Holdemanella porci]